MTKKSVNADAFRRSRTTRSIGLLVERGRHGRLHVGRQTGCGERLARLSLRCLRSCREFSGCACGDRGDAARMCAATASGTSPSSDAPSATRRRMSVDETGAVGASIEKDDRRFGARHDGRRSIMRPASSGSAARQRRHRADPAARRRRSGSGRAGPDSPSTCAMSRNASAPVMRNSAARVEAPRGQPVERRRRVGRARFGASPDPRPAAAARSCDGQRGHRESMGG